MNVWEFQRKLEELDSGIVVHPHSIVSYIIPPNANTHKMLAHFKQELVQAKKIKSSSNRISIIDSLQRVEAYLKNCGISQVNGVALYYTPHYRNVKTGMDGPLELCLEPPFKIKTTAYKCSNKVWTEPLWEQARACQGQLLYAIIDASEVIFALMSPHGEQILHKHTNNAPSKHGRGGQSAARFERLRTEKITHYIKNCFDQLTTLLTHHRDVEVVLGGAGQVKETFLNMLTKHNRSKVKHTVTLGKSGEAGLYEAIEKTKHVLKTIGSDENTRMIDAVFEHLQRGEAW
ncbi:eukaryotic peptide chain release factor subunit 1 isoform X1 [Procambarus clarkii]|uniref:eukaryotic peptide chain release factor subunit 1 isoform X1 n=1 Tax=Procambarus clarkii TaxID=6728 RepID=UPI0037434658